MVCRSMGALALVLGVGLVGAAYYSGSFGCPSHSCGSQAVAQPSCCDSIQEESACPSTCATEQVGSCCQSKGEVASTCPQAKEQAVVAGDAKPATEANNADKPNP